MLAFLFLGRPDGRAGVGPGGCWCACERVLLFLRQVRFKFKNVGGAWESPAPFRATGTARFEGVAVSSKYEESFLGIECSSVELLD